MLSLTVRRDSCPDITGKICRAIVVRLARTDGRVGRDTGLSGAETWCYGWRDWLGVPAHLFGTFRRLVPSRARQVTAA